MNRIPSDFDINASIAAVRAEKIAALPTVAEQLATIEEAVERLRGPYEVAKLAEANGWEHDWYPGSNWTVVLNVTTSQLKDIRRVFGKCSVQDKDIANVADHTIRVTLEFESHPRLIVRYVRPLNPGSACHIVEETRPAHRYHALVCDR